MTRRVSTYKKKYKVSKKGVRKSKTSKKSKRSTRKGGLLGFDIRGNLGKLAAKSGMVDEEVFTKDRGIGKFAKDSYNKLDSMGAVPHTSKYRDCQNKYINSGLIDKECEGYINGGAGGKRRRSKTSKKTKKTKKSKKSKRSTRKTRGGRTTSSMKDFESHLGPNATVKSGPITDQHKNSVNLTLSAFGSDPSRTNLISQFTTLQNAMNGASDWSNPTVQAIASQINPNARFDSEI